MTATTRFDRYRAVSDMPDTVLGWNLYGTGLDRFGRDGRAEPAPLPEPGPNELLVRVDAVSLCYSDVKICRLGNDHPKLRGRDLASQPARLGHEVALTVARPGADLAHRFHTGQRLALQPDVYINGASSAYGYVIPGGLVQFHLLGPEMLSGDGYVLPVADSLSYAETALSEPWACVEAAYTQRRRLSPKAGGTMWILGRTGDDAPYEIPDALLQSARIAVTDVPAAFVHRLRSVCGDRVVEKNGVSPAGFERLSRDLTGDAGFDDIIMLDPREARSVAAALKVLGRRGTFNLVSGGRLDGPVPVDVGRIHYDMLAIVGSAGPDIAASYGADRNRCELRAGGTLAVVGAGGPMGQMHVQRAIEESAGPAMIVASDVSAERLATLAGRFSSLAERHGKQLVVVNAANDDRALDEAVDRATGGRGADDVVACVPAAGAIAASARLLRPDGMLVVFAGVPHGTMVDLDLDAVSHSAAQYTGTSGSTLEDQQSILDKAGAGRLSMNCSVAAVGGLEAARDGLASLVEARFAGKVVLFPQLGRLPLTPLAELHHVLPSVAKALDGGDTWSPEAEAALIQELWAP